MKRRSLEGGIRGYERKSQVSKLDDSVLGRVSVNQEKDK